MSSFGGILQGHQLRARRVVIINDFFNVRGGATSRARLLADGLARLGLDVHFFCGDTPEETPQAGVTVHALGSVQLTERGYLEASVSGIHSRASARYLREVIASWDNPYTVYHIHGWSLIHSPSIFGALRKVSRRVVLHAHDMSLACPNIVYFNFPEGRICALKPLSFQCLASNCDKRNYGNKLWRYARHTRLNLISQQVRDSAPILAVHEDMEGVLRQSGFRGQVIAARNPAEAFFQSPVMATENRKIVFLGQLSDFKGVLDLARAASQSGVEVTIFGEGPLAAEARKICPALNFMGWKRGPELAAEMRKARAVVVPTRGLEPFGLVAVEALKSGIPVILSDGLMLSREIVGKDMGTSFPAGETGRLSELLARYSIDNELVGRQSSNAARFGHTLAPSEEEWLGIIMGVYDRTLLAAEQVQSATDQSCNPPMVEEELAVNAEALTK